MHDGDRYTCTTAADRFPINACMSVLMGWELVPIDTFTAF
jgi:hypothetical protein